MINLLAILMSLAMMLTGVSGMETPLDEPVARVLTLSELTISYNDSEVTLNPSLSAGVMTDGEESVYDFHIDSGNDRLLPFQAVVDDSGILFTSESSDTHVKLTAGEIDGYSRQINDMIRQSMASSDGEDTAYAEFMLREFMPAYVEVLKLAGDREAMAEFEKAADGVYDEIVDRGEGEPAQIDYDGNTYDVITYSYIIDSDRINQLVAAVYETNEVMSNYVKAYSRMIELLPREDTGLEDVDSFEKLMSKLDMRMNVTESISEADDLNISDMRIQMIMPDVDDPIEIDVHNEKLGDREESTTIGEYEIEGNTFEVYAESARDGEAARFTMTMSGDLLDVGTTVAFPEEAADADDADDADDAEDESEPEVEAAAEAFAETLSELVEGDVDVIDKGDITSDAEDGETDAEDDFYISVDFYSEPGDDGKAYGLSWSVDIKDVASVNFNVEGLSHSDGTCENLVNVYAYDDDEAYEVSFRLDVTNVPFAVNADGEKAVSVDAIDDEALLAGITGDAMKLSAEPSVRELVTLFGASSEAVEDTEEEADVDEAEEQPDEGADDAVGRSAEPYDDGVLAFGEPEFTWLPEGYEVTSMDVDTQYDMVNCELANAVTGDSIYVYFSTSVDGDVTYYTLAEDGSVSAILSQPVFVEEVDGDFRRFTADNGEIAISMYPYAGDVDVGTIGRILAGITYQDQAA